MSKPYYILVEKLPEQPWGIVFSDYDREVVREEAQDTLDTWACTSLQPKPNLRIIRSLSANQKVIDQLVDELIDTGKVALHQNQSRGY